MAEDAPECLTSLSQSLSSLVLSSLLFLPFNRKTELLFYLILCVAKMPFIPPVSIARSMSGLTAKERPISKSASTTVLTKIQREDKGGSVKERLASNIKQLGKKSQPRSHLPTAKGVSGADLHAKRRERLLPSSQTDSLPASSSGESLSKTSQHKHASSVKSEPEVKARARHQEEVHFTLTLTPEAVLLLQRRSSERRQHSASRKAGSGGGVSGSASDPRRRRENASKRHQPATQRNSTPNSTPKSRAAAKNSGEAELGDITSIVKISLLNEQHKYDDVEYEEEEDHGVDERVVLKCTEWLRGLENTPVTVGQGLNNGASGVKSF